MDDAKHILVNLYIYIYIYIYHELSHIENLIFFLIVIIKNNLLIYNLLFIYQKLLEHNRGANHLQDINLLKYKAK